MLYPDKGTIFTAKEKWAIKAWKFMSEFKFIFLDDRKSTEKAE